METTDSDGIGTLDFSKRDGMVPVIAQHARTGEVLMLGYATPEAFEITQSSGLLTFYSRSRETLWTKGETSGNTLRVVSLHADCDNDAVLALVEPAGPTCHTGARSCFGSPPTLKSLADTIGARRETPTDDSYTSQLLADRNLRLKKLGEETAELIIACADGDADRVQEEAADLIYHTMVACLGEGVELDDVLGVLQSRSDERAGS